jgi:hypothetical protein
MTYKHPTTTIGPASQSLPQSPTNPNSHAIPFHRLPTPDSALTYPANLSVCAAAKSSVKAAWTVCFEIELALFAGCWGGVGASAYANLAALSRGLMATFALSAVQLASWLQSAVRVQCVALVVEPLSTVYVAFG